MDTNIKYWKRKAHQSAVEGQANSLLFFFNFNLFFNWYWVKPFHANCSSFSSLRYLLSYWQIATLFFGNIRCGCRLQQGRPPNPSWAPCNLILNLIPPFTLDTILLVWSFLHSCFGWIQDLLDSFHVGGSKRLGLRSSSVYFKHCLYSCFLSLTLRYRSRLFWWRSSILCPWFTLLVKS